MRVSPRGRTGENEWVAAADRDELILIPISIARHEGVEVNGLNVESLIRAKATEFGTNEEMI